jgi:hypothetical protein
LVVRNNYQELDELPGGGGWQQSGVVLLGEDQSLIANDNTVLRERKKKLDTFNIT